MSEIPEPINSTAAAIDRWHEAQEEPPRGHMGCSALGHPCDRWLWLSFRWAVVEKFPGRIRRLFRRGHREEETIIADLEAIGITFEPPPAGKQHSVNFGAHISGSVDGVIASGVPEAPKKRHIAEFKTHARKSFEDVSAKGVEASKPMHYAQMQLYMHGKGIDRALYVAVCKDDDRIYTERVRYVKEHAEALLERGRRIALSDRMPEPLSTDPTWYQCKWCPAHAVCHQDHLSREVNCRTCSHVTALPDSTWHCARHNAGNIPEDFQREGCPSHVLHPDLVPWQRKASEEGWEAVYVIDGKDVRNGEPDAFTFGSREILDNPEGVAHGGELLTEARRIFPGAEVVSE